MKSVKLKTVPITIFGESKEFSYKEMVQVIMEAPQDPKGATIDEIRKSIRVLDVLEESTDTLELEDADYAYMLQKAKATKFSTVNQVFIDFMEDLEKAQ